MPDLDTPITTTEQLQDKINASLADRLQRERDKFADYDELKTFKASAEATLNAATQRISALEAENQTLTGSLSQKDADIERTRIAAAKKVPERWVIGSTKEEMETSADEWLTDAKTVAKPGFIPTQGTGDPNAQTTPYEAGAERARAKYAKN